MTPGRLEAELSNRTAQLNKALDALESVMAERDSAITQRDDMRSACVAVAKESNDKLFAVKSALELALKCVGRPKK